MNSYQTQLHHLGYEELKNRPTQKELEAIYQNSYFDSKRFEEKYTEDERFHKNVNFAEALEVCKKTTGKMLDIGCGEGFSLNYFFENSWEVSGIDYSNDGVKRHFPHLLKYLKVGDIYEQIEKFRQKNEKFDIIICNNVLEHLLDPMKFMKDLRTILKDDGIARVQVPNDNSPIHKEIIKSGLVNNRFWIAPREHMSYFNADSLENLARYCGYEIVDTLGDFPVDFALFNLDTNYIADNSKGKNCHLARIKIDNMLLREGVDKLVAFRRGCGQARIGRNIIIYITPSVK